MAWNKLGSDDGDGSSTDITVAFTANTFLQNMMYIEGSGGAVQYFRYGSSSTPDTADNYASRRSNNGNSDATYDTTQESLWQDNWNDGVLPQFWITYGINIAGEEKLMILFRCFQNTAGATNAPTRAEGAGKWINTSNQADVFEVNRASGNWTTNSNLSALGSDGVEELNVQDGAVYYDKTLNKEYVLSNNTWTEL